MARATKAYSECNEKKTMKQTNRVEHLLVCDENPHYIIDVVKMTQMRRQEEKY
jgi:hypothetical protein